MTAQSFQLLHPSAIEGLAQLSDPERAVSKFLVLGRAAGKLDLLHSLYPPVGIHPDQVAARFTFELMPGVIHEIGIMTSLLGWEEDPLVLGIIAHKDSAKLRAASGMDLDSQSLWVAVKHSTVSRQGRIFFTKGLYALIEAANAAELRDAWAHPRPSTVRDGIR